MTENELMIEKSMLIWLFTFDFIKLSGESVRKVSKKIVDSSLIEGWSFYYEPEERYLGLGEIESKKDTYEPTNSIFDDSKRLLKLFQSIDFHVLDEEFFEAQVYTRMHLKGFKVRLPSIEDPQEVSVVLMLTKYGVGCFGFFIDLNVPVTPSQLASFQILPKNEDQILRASLDLELMKEIGFMNEKFKITVDKRIKAGKTNIIFKKISLGEIVWFYMAAVINLGNNRKFKTFEDIFNKQRYETYIIHPIVIIEKTDPSYQSAFKLVQNHTKDIIRIVDHYPYLKNEDIADSAVEKLLQSSIPTDREDIWYHATIGSSIQIVSPRTQEISNERNDEDPKGQYFIDLIQPFVENEVVQIQRFITLMLEFFISKSDITLMEPREISLLKESIVKSLEIFHGIRVAGNSISQERIEIGKKVTLVNLVTNAITSKLELLEGAVEEYQESLKDFTQSILGILLGVVPAILFVLPNEPAPLAYIKLVLSVILSLGLTLLARYGAKYYWRKKQRKKSYI